MDGLVGVSVSRCESSAKLTMLVIRIDIIDVCCGKPN